MGTTASTPIEPAENSRYASTSTAECVKLLWRNGTAKSVPQHFNLSNNSSGKRRVCTISSLTTSSTSALSRGEHDEMDSTVSSPCSSSPCEAFAYSPNMIYAMVAHTAMNKNKSVGSSRGRRRFSQDITSHDDHTVPIKALRRSKTITHKIHSLNHLEQDMRGGRDSEWSTAHLPPRVAPKSHKRTTRPLACPDPSLQRSSSTSSIQDPAEAALRETMYDHATWRMYYRITNARQTRERQLVREHPTAPGSRPVPIRNSEEQLYDEFECVDDRQASLLHKDCNPPPTGVAEEGVLSGSFHSGIFVMDMED